MSTEPGSGDQGSSPNQYWPDTLSRMVAFFDHKLAEGKTRKEALRALKRRISDAVYRQLLTEAH